MRKINSLLKRYGTKISIGDKTFYATITPFIYKSRIYTEGEYTPLGYADDSTYIIIAPASADLKNCKIGSIIHTKNGDYLLYHSDNYYINDKCIYSFGYLKRRVL